MSLGMFNDVEKLGEFDVVIMDKLREQYPEKFNESGAMDYQWFEKEIRPKNFVYVRQDVGSISFTLQNGPIKEVGVNGCQIDTIILAARTILAGFNTKAPSRETACAITKLDEALHWLEARTKDRITRKVEGTSEA